MRGPVFCEDTLLAHGSTSDHIPIAFKHGMQMPIAKLWYGSRATAGDCARRCFFVGAFYCVSDENWIHKACRTTKANVTCTVGRGARNRRSSFEFLRIHYSVRDLSSSGPSMIPLYGSAQFSMRRTRALHKPCDTSFAINESYVICTFVDCMN